MLANRNNKQGFTIIEVVLVLAIAGLIFLMVFIALPNMQRAQRDTQRRNDYSALSANMTQYMTNNNGRLPTVGATLEPNNYINESGEDPAGTLYTLEIVECASGGGDSGNCTLTGGTSGSSLSVDRASKDGGTTVYVVRKAACNNGYVEAKSSNRAFAIYGGLETGNGTYCQSNS